MRKVIVILAAFLLFAGGAAFAAWRMADSGGSEESAPATTRATPFQSQLQETASADAVEDVEVTAASQDASTGADYESAADGGGVSGEDFTYTSPDQRYVTETQRHQNFFKAVGEGRVVRLDIVSADVRPVGDLSTSYLGFTLVTTDGDSGSGTMVMKYNAGMWRIATISQLEGDLQGGTNYVVPKEFEDVLAREISELQPFLTRMAEGRLAYMEIYGVDRSSEDETVLTGVVVGKSGVSFPAEMRLRRDYGIWHLTYITDPS